MSASTVSSFPRASSSSSSSLLRGGRNHLLSGRKMTNDLSGRKTSFFPEGRRGRRVSFLKTEAMFEKFTLKNPFQTDPAMKTKERYQPIVQKVNQLEQSISSMTDEELRGQTEKFRQRLANGKESLDQLLPEAFATVREASKRVLGLRPFDVQVIGGVILQRRARSRRCERGKERRSRRRPPRVRERAERAKASTWSP